jgi:hypothetical protein
MFLIEMARSDSLKIYGLILNTLLNTLRFISDEKHPIRAPLGGRKSRA